MGCCGGQPRRIRSCDDPYSPEHERARQTGGRNEDRGQLRMSPGTECAIVSDQKGCQTDFRNGITRQPFHLSAGDGMLRELLRRDPSYFVVAGIALEREMSRLRGLSVFADGPLARRTPELKVRRARRRPNRLGFAVPSQFRLSVTAYPGIHKSDVLEVLLHELVHLHVGRTAEAHAWHGPTFKRTLARAMAEGYGIAELRPSSTLHGTYAEAIERARLGNGEQLAIPLAA